MTVDPKEADTMRELLLKIADMVFTMYPSEIADEALRSTIDMTDPEELATATCYWNRAGAEIHDLILRSKRHHDERDRLH